MTVSGAPGASDRGINIVMVAARFPPFIGGVETHVREVSRRLASMGDTVVVVTTDPVGDLPPCEDVDGVKVVRVRARPRNSDLMFAPGIASWIQPRPQTIVHCQGFHTLVAPIAMAAAAARGVPFVVTFHSGRHNSTLRNAIIPVQTALLRPLLVRARRLIAVSEFEAALFRRRLRLAPGRIAVIPNGADLPLTRSARPPGDRENLIVSVGRLERFKGHQRVVAALPFVAEQIPDVRLRIVGTGPFEASIRRAAEAAGVAERVEIGAIGRAERTTLIDLLGRARLVTLLSDYESQGLAALEGLAAGAPVLATDTAALRDLGSRGLVTTVPLRASSRVVAQAIVRALRDPAVLTTPPRLPSWEDTARALHSMYREVLEEVSAQ